MKRIYKISDFIDEFNTIVEDELSEYYGEYEFVWLTNLLGYLDI